MVVAIAYLTEYMKPDVLTGLEFQPGFKCPGPEEDYEPRLISKPHVEAGGRVSEGTMVCQWTSKVKTGASQFLYLGNCKINMVKCPPIYK